MKIWVMSDLHQEVARFEWVPPTRPDFDVLVVAGDVYEGDLARGIDWVARVADGKPAVMVAGNHEFWGQTAQDVRELGLRLGPERGVTFLDGQGWVEVAGINFVGCTLWTDMRLNVDALSGPNHAREFGEGVDMRGAGIDRRAKVRDILRWHAADVAMLEEALGLDPPEGPKVVVTHHAPHAESVHPAWRSSSAGAHSASDLTHLVACDVADLWIHGHVHTSADYVPGNVTRVLCNPFGTYGMNADYVEDLVVDLPAPETSPTP